MTKYFRSIIRHFVVWTFAFNFWSILRQYGQDLVSEPNLALFDWALLHIALGVMAGIILGTVDHYFIQSITRKYSFGVTLIIESLVYLVIFIFLITTGVLLSSVWQNIPISSVLIEGFIFSKGNFLLITYCYLVAFLLNFITQVDKKFGQGNLVRMLQGSFTNPKKSNEFLNHPLRLPKIRTF